MEKLLLEVARCEEAKKVFSGEESPCKEIVKSQGYKEEDFQVPEPWSGHLDKARILFISPNPSIEKNSEFPIKKWSDKDIADFFENRFGGGRKEWIKDGIYPLLNNGKHREKSSRFLKNVKKCACELLKKDESQIEPGKDYALMEVVHCKSKKVKEGVKTARERCSNNYFKKIIEKSPAKLIISCGNHAHQAILDIFFDLRIDKFCYKDDLESKKIKKFSEKRWFAFIKHPSWYPNPFQPEEIEKLQSILLSNH